MNTILQNIKTQLEKVSELKYIDEDWGQLNIYGMEIPVKWPCALVRLTNASFSDIGTNIRANPINRQEGNLSFEIIIAKVKLTNSSNRAPVSQQTKAFDIWELIEKVHQVLQGWSPIEHTGKLIRTSIGSTKRDDGIQEIRIVYICGIHDY